MSLPRFLLALALCFVLPARAGTITASGSMGVSFGSTSAAVGDGGFAQMLARTYDPFSSGVPGSDFDNLLRGSYTPKPLDRAGGIVKETYKIGLGAAKERAALTVGRVVTMAELGVALAAVGGAAYAGAQIGAPISKLLGNDTLDIGDMRCLATNTGWQCDDGKPPLQKSAAEFFCYGQWRGSLAECFDILETSIKNSWLSDGYTVEGLQIIVTSETETFVEYTGTYSATKPNQATQFRNIGSNGMPKRINPAAQVCEATIDALNPAYSRPEGHNQAGPDGKCPTGRYGPRSPEDFAKLVRDYGKAEFAHDVIKELLDDKGGAIPVQSPRIIDGPDQLPGPTATTTTTNPDGSRSTTGTQRQVIYDYSKPDEVSWHEEETTATTDGNGTTTTTTTGDGTTTTTGGGGVRCEPGDKTAGCAELGRPSADKPKWSEKSVLWNPEDLGLPAACPADRVLDLSFRTFVIPFAQFCDPMIQARPIVLAVAAFFSMFFSVGAISSSRT